MAKYTPLTELPRSDVLTQSIDGNEPDIHLAFELMHARTTNFIRHRIMWDVALPLGADDNNRISLNVSRMDKIRAIGGYSLIHFIDVSEQDSRTHYLGDGGVENGVLVGIDVNHLTQWSRGRYEYLMGINLTDESLPLLAQDAVWAEDIEASLRVVFSEAGRELTPIQAKMTNLLTHLPGLVKLSSKN